MGTAAAARGEIRPGVHARPQELRAALELTLTEAENDESIGPLIAATHLRLRIEFTDAGLALNLASEEGARNLTWSFGDAPGWRPKLTLRMDSETANRYLQGRESLAIAIARGRVRCRGEPRVALVYLPAARLICEPYRRVIEREFPDLVRT